MIWISLPQAWKSCTDSFGQKLVPMLRSSDVGRRKGKLVFRKSISTFSNISDNRSDAAIVCDRKRAGNNYTCAAIGAQSSDIGGIDNRRSQNRYRSDFSKSLRHQALNGFLIIGAWNLLKANLVKPDKWNYPTMVLVSVKICQIPIIMPWL